MPMIVFARELHHHYHDSEGSTLNPLLQEWMEHIMAKIDDLMTVLTAIHDDVAGVLDRAKNLETQLTQLQQSTPPQVDLQPAIDAATAIRQQLEGTNVTTSDATGAAPSTSDTSQPTGDTSQPTDDSAASTGDTSQPTDDQASDTATDPAA